MAVNILIVFGSSSYQDKSGFPYFKGKTFFIKTRYSIRAKVFWTLINLFTCIFGQNIEKGLKSDK
jgi:hypothetical protein